MSLQNKSVGVSIIVVCVVCLCVREKARVTFDFSMYILIFLEFFKQKFLFLQYIFLGLLFFLSFALSVRLVFVVFFII